MAYKKSYSRFQAPTGYEWQVGRVTEITDGDTLVFSSEGRVSHVRLAGIDASELGHKKTKNEFYAVRAKSQLTSLTVDKPLSVLMTTQPVSFERKIGFFYDLQGHCINADMISSGLAFAARQFNFSEAATYCSLEEEARQAGRGMWAKAPALPSALQDLMP